MLVGSIEMTTIVSLWNWKRSFVHRLRSRPQRGHNCLSQPGCQMSWTGFPLVLLSPYCWLLNESDHRDSLIGIATCYRLDGPGIESRWGLDIPHPSRQALQPTQPPVQCVPSLSGGKVAGARRWLTIPSILEVKERVELYQYLSSPLRNLSYGEAYLTSLHFPSHPLFTCSLFAILNRNLYLNANGLALHSKASTFIYKKMKPFILAGCILS